MILFPLVMCPGYFFVLFEIVFETVSCSYITQKDKNTRQIMKRKRQIMRVHLKSTPPL